MLSRCDFGFGMFVQKDRLELLEALSEGNSAVVIENTIQATILVYFNAQLQSEKKRTFSKVSLHLARIV